MIHHKCVKVAQEFLNKEVPNGEESQEARKKQEKEVSLGDRIVKEA